VGLGVHELQRGGALQREHLLDGRRRRRRRVKHVVGRGSTTQRDEERGGARIGG